VDNALPPPCRARVQLIATAEVIGRVGSGEPDSDRIADPPEDWPAAPPP